MLKVGDFVRIKDNDEIVQVVRVLPDNKCKCEGYENIVFQLGRDIEKI
jgi:aerobic-type carbon monoxide dehydrogenase small subunit (CoxS/CutS family)